jgi:acetylornithine deacetylase/succinyl-diaminopimelate desuccinylase-like protein
VTGTAERFGLLGRKRPEPAPAPLTAALSEADRELLLRLLAIPTAGPLEGGVPQLWRAQTEYAQAAAELGFTLVRHAPATVADATRPDVPLAVRAACDPEFLTAQPSLVLRLGPPLPRHHTVMFNVHLDTVAGDVPVGFDGVRFTGRGAIDAKGPAVALLAGIRAAGVTEGVLLQVVSGEEGGALGTIGTRPLVEAGYVGGLNVFCEPTGLRWSTRATAALTAEITVDGEGAVDDDPAAGHNATVLLGHLAQHLAKALAGTRACVSGLHTGTAHNRVYGTGTLQVTIGYPDRAAGLRLERAVEWAFRSGLDSFAEEFRDLPEFARTAADAGRIAALRWAKRGLPALDGPEPAEFSMAGIERWPAAEPAFTCDAIWLHDVPDTRTVVFGPGSLTANRAHADGEFADLAELEAFATAVARVLRIRTFQPDPAQEGPA